MFKAFVYVFTIIFVGAFKFMGAIVTVISMLIANAINAVQRSKEEKRQREAAQAKARWRIEGDLQSADLANEKRNQKRASLENMLKTEVEIAMACEKEARNLTGYKRLTWIKRQQAAEARADALQDKLDKL